jgi:hypothetical protein
LGGHFWAGLFKTDVPVRLPEGLKPVLGPRRLVVLLVRYRQGTLRYDELAVGAPARRGFRFGLYVDCIWVDDPASLWGGRRIWGLAKERADFAWDGDTVRVTDDAGAIAALTFDQHGARPLPAWLPVPLIGRRDGGWAFTVATLRARLGRAGMRVCEWSPRFPYRVPETALLAVAAPVFRMTVPPPKILRP